MGWQSEQANILPAIDRAVMPVDDGGAYRVIDNTKHVACQAQGVATQHNRRPFALHQAIFYAAAR